jgi:hypothetical protein
MFECTLFYALDQTNHTCVPWYIPSHNKSITICDPWQAQEFFKLMVNEIPDETWLVIMVCFIVFIGNYAS